MKKTTALPIFYTLIWGLLLLGAVSCNTSVVQEVSTTTTVSPTSPPPTDIVSAVQEPDQLPTATQSSLEEEAESRDPYCQNPYSGRGVISWSPDGKYLSYTDSRGVIKILSLDRNQSMVANYIVTPGTIGRGVMPAWSPDSQQIAYIGSYPDNHLYLTDFDGHRQIQSDDFSVNSAPQWFPDGEQLLLEIIDELGPDYYYKFSIALYTLQTKTLNFLVETPIELKDDYLMTFQLSPDGNYVAYDYTPNVWDDYYGIYIMDVSGGDPIKISDDETCEAGPRWSPDGERIAFTSNRDGEHRWDVNLFVMEKDGSNVVKLTNTWTNGYTAPRQYVWSPDGTKILYHTNKRVGSVENFIQMVDVTTGEITDILTENEEMFDFKDPEWSPNGEVVAFTFRKHGEDARYLGIINLQSGERTELDQLGQ